VVLTGTLLAVLLPLDPAARGDDQPSPQDIAASLRAAYDTIAPGLVLKWRQRSLTVPLFEKQVSLELMWRAADERTDATYVVRYVHESMEGEGWELSVHAKMLRGEILYELVGTRYRYRHGKRAERVDPLGWSNVLIETVERSMRMARNPEKRFPPPLNWVTCTDPYLTALGMCVGPYQGGLRLLSPDDWFGASAGLIHSGGQHEHAYWDRSGVKELSKQFVMALPEFVMRGQVVGAKTGPHGLVVELVGPAGHRVWLAERYGYQPVRWEWHCPAGGHLVAVGEFSDYRQITERLWLPFRFRREYKGEWFGLQEDRVVEFEIERAEGRVPSTEELEELFFAQVPEQKCYVLDYRWVKDPWTDREVAVSYPWVRDRAHREQLRRQALARKRAVFDALRRGVPVPRWAALPVVVVTAIATLALLLLWRTIWRNRG